MLNNALVAQVTSFLGWSFLPAFLTNLALNGFYTLFPHVRPVLPPNPSPQQVTKENARANLHQRIARGTLVVAYLAYTIVSVYVAQQQVDLLNFYSYLALPRHAVQAGGAAVVKSHWRRVARAYHPDKVGASGEALFVALRRAVECLEHDDKRWAYERFGPSVLDWRHVVTKADYMYAGLQGLTVFYVFLLVSLVLVSVFRSDQQPYLAARLLLLLVTLSVELAIVVQGAEPLLFRLVFPNRLPFEHVALVRQLFISSSLALAHLTPLINPSGFTTTAEERALADMKALEPLIRKLRATSEAIANESLALQRAQVDPFVPKEGDSPHVLRKKAEEMARLQTRVQQTVARLQGGPVAPPESIVPGLQGAGEAGIESDRDDHAGEAGDATQAEAASKAKESAAGSEMTQRPTTPVSLAPLEAESTPSAPPEDIASRAPASTPDEGKPDGIVPPDNQPDLQ